MGNSVHWLKDIESFVNNRRDQKHPGNRSAPNRPEHSNPNKSAKSADVEQKPDSLSTLVKKSAATTPTPKKLQASPSSNTIASTNTTTTMTSSNQCSDFYFACRNNDSEKVKRFLEHIDLDQIDAIEPNGSTALHVACYHGHRDIVKLLLESGADRALCNKFNCLPFDEAKNDGIKELFYRIPSSNRYVSRTGAIEWDLINDDALENAVQERHGIRSLYDNDTGITPVKRMFEKIEKNYIENGLSNFNGIDKIQRFFHKATEEQDPIWIIKAYTAETDFYKILNQEIAGGASKYQNERRYIIAILSYHPKLDDYSFTDTCYRVMQVSPTDLQKYQVNCSLMTKSFLSSSIDEKVAVWFLGRQEVAKTEQEYPQRCNANGKLIKQWVMCIYHIKHPRTALYIESSSQYANEGEVLIMPYTVFQVKDIQRVKVPYTPDDRYITQIQLEECDHYLDI